MAGKQVSGDGVPPSLAGMSKNQLYDIMCQMKALIEQNKQQARQILIQNPALTKALFQAQIMLGMVQSAQASPAISSTVSQSPQASAVPNQKPNIQVSAPVSGQNQIRKQQLNQPISSHPPSQSLPPPNPQPQSMPSHPLQQTQPPKGHISAQSAPMSVPQPSQVPSLAQLPQHTAPQQPSLHQLPMPSLSTQSQQPLPNSGSQYLPHQPPLPPQPRPPMSIPGFPHQAQPQMGPNSGFQHPSGPQMHHPQHMFHPGSKPLTGMGPSFQQGQLPLPNQSLPQSVYQGGNPHLGMDFNQIGSSKQPERGSNWMHGLPENTAGQLLGPQQGFLGQAGPSNQLARPPSSLNPELEKALLQQVMSLTPEQINMLPAEQRNQVLQLQQILRH